ncbi:Poly(ADP-ribose) glycohydrolase [Aphelenchoides fujianensis]|nr:Poly(ADP-ribose) glycohydrolase [Aphelenchoides fujianensis]
MDKPRVIRRSLDDPALDVYLARFDPVTQTTTPVDRPRVPDGCPLLELPYANPYRYRLIETFLTRASHPYNIQNLIAGMETYLGHGNNFAGLLKFYSNLNQKMKETLTQKVIPFMAQLALELTDQNFRAIPLLLNGTNMSVSMSQRQAAVLIANGFFCTFPAVDRVAKEDFNTFNMIRIFSDKCEKSAEKLACIFAYFRSLFESMPDGMLTILRQSCPPVDFAQLEVPLSAVFVEEEARIEDAVGHSHVDFANRFIGGGVLGNGCVQEEIRFLVSPECLVSCLLCERMADDEAILLIVAIDALCFGDPQKRGEQFAATKIDRELLKAFAGFAIQTPHSPLPIATGNWGGGAFHGDRDLKFLIQWLAASAAGRLLHYHTFGARAPLHPPPPAVAQSWLYRLLTDGGEHPPAAFVNAPIFHVFSAPMDAPLERVDVVRPMDSLELESPPKKTPKIHEREVDGVEDKREESPAPNGSAASEQADVVRIPQHVTPQSARRKLLKADVLQPSSGNPKSTTNQPKLTAFFAKKPPAERPDEQMEFG